MTFTLIEDEYIIALHMRKCLEREGHICLGHEADGEKGLRLVEDTRPDIVILDILLAGAMSGIDAAVAIRKFSDAPIVFTTGYTSYDMLRRLEGVSNSLVLSKPVSMTKLVAAFRGFLEKS